MNYTPVLMTKWTEDSEPRGQADPALPAAGAVPPRRVTPGRFNSKKSDATWRRLLDTKYKYCILLQEMN
jgi:hypothetical protein